MAAHGVWLGFLLVIAPALIPDSLTQYTARPIRRDELTLYLIHGALHLAGYDDKSPEQCQRMREREQYYMQRRDLWGLGERDGDAASATRAEPAAETAERMPGE